MRGPKVKCGRLALANRHARAAESKWRRLVLAVTGTQLLEVLWCGLMAILEDDQAELENCTYCHYHVSLASYCHVTVEWVLCWLEQC